MRDRSGTAIFLSEKETASSKVSYILDCTPAGRQPLMQVSELESGPPLPTYWNSDCQEDLDCYNAPSPGARMQAAWRAAQRDRR